MIAFATFTGFYIGGTCGFIYALYPRFARSLLKRAPTSKEEGVISSLLDNFVHVPVLYIPTFYASTRVLQGDDCEMALQHLRTNWWESVVSCCAFWLPAQFVIFSMVPAPARVRCVAAGDFVWNVALSYLANRPEAGTAQG